jgi:hypothetical protein
MTRLGNGNIVILGGAGQWGCGASLSVQIFDTTTNTISAPIVSPTNLNYATLAIPLKDSDERILAFSGFYPDPTIPVMTNKSTIFNPKTLTWTVGGNMQNYLTVQSSVVM